MSDYLENLLERASVGLEMAGEGMRAEINIDCHNVVKILTQLAQANTRIEELESEIKILRGIRDKCYGADNLNKEIKDNK